VVTRRRVELTAATLSLVAGVIHGALAPEHLEEWWGYGAFFIAAAAAQIAFAIIVVLEPWRRNWLPDRPPLDHARQRRWTYVAGILGNVAIIGLYIYTRTIGIPAGPHAGIVEEVMVIDMVAKVSEIGIVVCLMQLLRMPVEYRDTAPTT
jgi:hypothetical protein